MTIFHNPENKQEAAEQLAKLEHYPRYIAAAETPNLLVEVNLHSAMMTIYEGGIVFVDDGQDAKKEYRDFCSELKGELCSVSVIHQPGKMS